MSIRALAIVAAWLIAGTAIGQDEKGRGYVYPSAAQRKALHAEAYKMHGFRQYYQVKNMTAPATWDSRTNGWIPPIRDQGSCGDCFGVEASDALTIAYIKNGWQKADGSFVISEQYGLDYRDAYQGGCNGGDGPQVYNYMKRYGFPAEKYVSIDGVAHNDYPPYTARPGDQRLKPGARMWGKEDLTWGYVTSNQSDRPPTVDEVKAGIMKYATVTYAFDAGGLSGMQNNVVRRLGDSIDHEITGFIGWDDNKACPDGTKGAFISRNQWGAGFADGGYFWLPYSQLRHVVEACFLTVAPLPPPPPPPPDPTPIPPIGGLRLILKQTTPEGEYLLMDAKRMELFQVQLDRQRALAEEMQKLLDEFRENKVEVKPPMPAPEVKKLPEGPKEEKKPEAKPESKAKPKIIDGALQADRDAVAGLQAKVKDVERSRNVVVSVSHEFDVATASPEDLRREREWLTRRLEAMSKP